MKNGAIIAACALALAMGCTVDVIVGSNVLADGGPDGGRPFDGGTPICPGTGTDCTQTCGDQVCHAGCTGLQDCVITCSGTSCSFHCERPEGQTCTPSCEPGPCSMQCTPSGSEAVDCQMTCEPAQTCAADCHGGNCTVACGQLVPATSCDGGVYSCSGTCPP